MAREVLTLKRKKPIEEKPETKPIAKPAIQAEVEVKPEVKKVEIQAEVKPIEKRVFPKMEIEILRRRSFDSYPDSYKKRVKKLAAVQYPFFKDELEEKERSQLMSLSRAFSEKIYFKFCSLGIMEYYERQPKES